MEKTPEYLTFKQLTSQHFVPVGWYNNTFPTTFTMQWHLHQQFEIMYCEKGAFVFEYMFSDDKNAVFRVPVPEKHFILLNAGYYHRIAIESNDTQIYNVELFPKQSFEREEEGLIKEVSPSARELFALNAQLSDLRDKNERFYVFHDSQNVGSTMKELVEDLNDSNSPSIDLSVRILTLKLFLDISKCSSNIILEPIKLTYVRKAILFMQRNFIHPLSVNEIAESVGIAPAYLQRLFKSELGEGIHATLTGIRVNNAKNLLETTSLPNNEIAKLSGFSSREQLIYSFHSTVGCSPHEYRITCNRKNIRVFPWPDDVELSDE